MTLDRDSYEYELLQTAAASIVAEQVPGLTCEIGVRAGGGSQVILDELTGSPLAYTHIAIDPWGSLPYPNRHGVLSGDSGYDNRMKRQALADLYWYANCIGVDLWVAPMTDSEFFRRFSDGVPLYRNGASLLVNDYALVHYDAQHTTHAVLEQVKFFGPRSVKGARWVFDDYDWYDWPQVVYLAEMYGFGDARMGARKLVMGRTA